MKNKNFYLNALEYGEKMLEESKSISYIDLKSHLKKLGYKFETEAEEHLLKDMAREAFHIYVEEGEEWKDRKQHYLNIEGYFKLLEYRELNQARASAKEARRYAILAIAIAIVTLIGSVIFSYRELNQSVRIDPTQFETIKNSLDNPSR